jgi:hypothetical protein
MYVFYKTPFCASSPFSHDPSIYSSITQPRISFARASSFPEPRYYSKTRVYFFHHPLRLGRRARPSVTALSKKSNQAKYQRPVLNLGVSTIRWCGAIDTKVLVPVPRSRVLFLLSLCRSVRMILPKFREGLVD